MGSCRLVDLSEALIQVSDLPNKDGLLKNHIHKVHGCKVWHFFLEVWLE